LTDRIGGVGLKKRLRDYRLRALTGQSVTCDSLLKMAVESTVAVAAANGQAPSTLSKSTAAAGQPESAAGRASR
jgi:hypothetical protein